MKIKNLEAVMGRFSVEMEIANQQDVLAVELGVLSEDKVRRSKVMGVVDTGATRLVLPGSVVKSLGLAETGKVGVRYADGRKSKKKMVGYAEVTIHGRTSVFSAVVEPKRDNALIGAIVLEELDFVTDCTGQKLVPRDPKGILAELE